MKLKNVQRHLLSIALTSVIGLSIVYKILLEVQV